MQLTAYTDGSNTYNGFEYSYGGYGWVLVLSSPDEPEPQLIKGGGSMPVNKLQPVTNNRAELMAIISLLEYVHDNELFLCEELNIFSDSQWCVKSISGEWSTKKNLDLFVKFGKLRKQLKANGVTINVNWIRGHAGHVYNELADDLAGAYADLVKQPKPTKQDQTIGVL